MAQVRPWASCSGKGRPCPGPHSTNIFPPRSGGAGRSFARCRGLLPLGWLPGVSSSPRPFFAWGAHSSPFARPGCCQRATVATARLCTTPPARRAPQPGGLSREKPGKKNKPPGWWSSRKVWNPLGSVKLGTLTGAPRLYHIHFAGRHSCALLHQQGQSTTGGQGLSMSEISIPFACPSAVGMISRGPGRAALAGPLMSTTLPGGGGGRQGRLAVYLDP